MKFNISIKKILHTKGANKHEESSMLFDQFFSLSSRKFADIGVNILKDSKITPNQITVVRAIIFLPLIFYLFSKGTYAGNILGVLCCWLNTLFDCLDGNLARAKSLTSKIGEWLDHNLDKIMVYFTLMGVILGSYNFTQNNIFLVAGIFVLFLHAMIANIYNDYTNIFEEDIIFDLPLKEAVYHHKKSTFFDKIFVNMFVFNSFWSYLFFTIRYQILIGAIFGIMPYMIFYWGIVFFVRWVFLCLVYLSIPGKKESHYVFVSELKKRSKI